MTWPPSRVLAIRAGANRTGPTCSAPPVTPGEAVRADAHEVLTRGTREVVEEIVAAEREPVPAWLVEHLCITDTMAFVGGLEAEATEPELWAAVSSLHVPVLLLVVVDGDGQRVTALGRQLVQALRTPSW